MKILSVLLITFTFVFSVTSASADERATLNYAANVDVAASAEDAWDTFKTFGKIENWHPATSDTVLLVGQEGEPMAVREFQVDGGHYVISELLAYDEDRMWFNYRIIKTSLPLANYVAEMWVEDGSDGGSTIHWKADFQRPDGSAADQDAATEGLVEAVFAAGLGNLATLNN